MDVEVEVLQEALQDLTEAILYVETQRRGLGAQLLLDYRDAIRDITRYPHANPYLDETRQIRRKQLVTFKYGIVYRVRSNTLTVHGLIHLQRNYAAWRDRF